MVAMHGQEQIRLVLQGDVHAPFQGDEAVIHPGHLHPVMPGGEQGVAKLQPGGQRDGLFIIAIRGNGAGVMAAMPRVEHDQGFLVGGAGAAGEGGEARRAQSKTQKTPPCGVAIQTHAKISTMLLSSLARTH